MPEVFLMLAAQLSIAPVDLVIVVAYFVIIIGLGCLAGVHRRRGSEGKDYFLAGRNLTWPVIGLALFSTNISTVHLVGMAQEGYVNGLAYGNFEWMAPFVLICLALFFAPFYVRSRVATLPDFLERRYNPACRNWLAGMSILSAITIHIAFSLYTGAIVFKAIFGIDLVWSIIGISALTGLYTIVGGLMAVVLTESLQTIILLAGAIAITAIGYGHVGGWAGLTQTLADHGESVKLSILRSGDDPSGLPWYSVLLGYPVIGLWYFCTDQTIVQRVLGARNENHARVGPLFCGFIKILPVFIFVLPGTIALALVYQGRMPALPVKVAAPVESPTAGSLSPDALRVYQAVDRHTEKTARTEQVATETGLKPEAVSAAVRELEARKLLERKSDDVYAHMIQELLPTGLKGVVTAALLAALMSTVSGALNSIATLFCYDIYQRWRPHTSDHSLVRLGRWVTFIAMVLSIIWTPYLDHFKGIFQGIQVMIGYFAPPITAVFLWGVFWRRASATAALSTLVAGSCLGFTVFMLDWFKAYTHWSMPFMIASFGLFVICSGVLVVVSLITPPPPSCVTDELVWKSPLDALRGEAWRGIGNYKVLAGILFVIMVALYVVFR
jgi:solute:Na+ symporter, SSS family